MSLTSIETRYLISEGFKPENIHNPYIYEMWQKNKFKLGEHISSIDAAFYIVPMINAVQRSGTIEEKELLFKSMLKYEAFQQILSNKRGHKVGEMERLIDQAVRMSTNVKNRQTRAQDAAMADLEKMIEDQHLLNHKVILFTLDEGQIDRNIGGLIANKIANEYQRPCCILSKAEATPKNSLIFDPTDDSYHPTFDLITTYQGSARGYEQTGVTIEVYDKKYKNLSGTTTRFIPDDLFILIPEGDLGYTWFGTTPEEADLRSSSIANVSVVDTGVAITTTEVADPVTVDTKVSQVTLPSFEAADKIIIADVL